MTKTLVKKRTPKNRTDSLDHLFKLAPVVKITVDKWAEQNRVLSNAHAIPGPWRTSEVEVGRAMMHAVTEPGVRKITLMTSPQLTKSEVLLNTIGYFLDCDPAALLLVQPTQDSADAFSRERISKLLRETKSLRDKHDPGKRMGEDSLSFKSFKNGAHLSIAYAGAPSQVASRPIRVLLCDEVDLWKTSDTGDPLTLAYERVNTFKNSLIVQASTPTWATTSRIALQYNLSDQRRGFCKCPGCGEWIVFNFFKNPVKNAEYLCGTVEWEKDNPGSAHIYCGCGYAWTEIEKLSAVTTEGGIRFMQTRPFACDACGGDVQEPLKTRRWEWSESAQCGYALCSQCNTRVISNEHVGFQASKLLSPHVNIVTLAQRWVDACGDSVPEAKLAFYQTDLGLPADAASFGATVESNELMERREEASKGVPPWVLRLTVGCDVQHDSIHVLVCGWGLGERCLIIDHRVFAGDTSQRDVWDRLYEFLHGEYPYKASGVAGLSIKMSCVFVDSGDGTTSQQVLDFVDRRGKRLWFASKGSSDTGNVWAPIVPPFVIKKTRDSNEARRPVIVGTNAAKKILYDRLAINEPGPGYVHLPVDIVGETFLEQMTSEHMKTTIRGGFRTMRFVPRRAKAANEVLDCWVLSLAALRYLVERKFGSLERVAQKTERDLAEYRSP